jgi:hypothetical protein
MDKRLTIKNIQKIWGKQVYSKWLPGTYGWAVQSVEGINDRYFFELRSNGKFKHAEIQLKRDPVKYNPDDKVFLYEMWAWNLENNKPEQMWFSKQELDTMEGMAMRLGVMLEKIIPKNKV